QGSAVARPDERLRRRLHSRVRPGGTRRATAGGARGWGRITGEAERSISAVSRWLNWRTPNIPIVLCSAVGDLAERIRDARRWSYTEIPGFPPATVAGHEGELIAGALAGVPVLIQRGRFHMYEGHAASVVTHPVRLFHAVGVRTLIVTNAA